MRVTVVGAGAVGGYVAARMAMAGYEVAVLGRKGAHLDAMRAGGLGLSLGEQRFQAPLAVASDRAEDLPVPEVVFIGLKSHLIPEIAESIQPLLGKHTAVVSIVNGIPWWYAHGVRLAWPEPWLKTVDDGGRAWKAIAPERALGCVTNVAARVVEPGHIRVGFDSWYRLGEPAGGMSPRLMGLTAAMQASGLMAEAVEDIRAEVWHKIWGNAAYNPISVLTAAPMNRIARDPMTRPIAMGMMQEVQKLAVHLGVTALKDLEERLAVAEKLGAHKSSMLQDWEKGASLEIDTILGALCEIAAMEGLAVPKLELVYGLVKQKQAIRREHAEVGDA